MIDFVKVITKQPKSFLRNKHLDFNGTFKENGGEISNKYEAEFNSMKFIYFEKTELLEIKGSLHKYFNNGLHNYNDFNYNNLIFVLNDISTRFNINLKECILQNIEFGLNIKPPLETNELLKNLLIHKTEIFKEISILKGNFKQAVHSQFIIKTYNKAMQYKVNENIFRYEIKVIKMQKLNNINLKSLLDLKDKSILNAFFNVLLNEWNNIILFEKPLQINDLKPILRNKKIYQWNSLNFWNELTKQARNKQRNDFNKYINKHTENNYKKIKNILELKFIELIK